MIFESWANVGTDKTTFTVLSTLKKMLETDLFRAVTGEIGQALTGTKYAKGLLRPAFDTFMTLM